MFKPVFYTQNDIYDSNNNLNNGNYAAFGHVSYNGTVNFIAW